MKLLSLFACHDDFFNGLLMYINECKTAAASSINKAYGSKTQIVFAVGFSLVGGNHVAHSQF
jgi:hypothetical protein